MKLPVFILAALASVALADQRGDTPGMQSSTPQEQLAKFHVPPGFEVQLVAAEPDIQKPINLNFDAAGRLWVSGSELYPWPASTDANRQPIADFDKGWKGIVDGFRVGDAPQPSAEAKDSVRILSDFDPAGHARKITIFADKLNIPSGIQPLPRKPGTKGDTAIVYSIPNIWLVTDVDGDGFAEKREPLYTGFGYTDTHGGSSSYIYWIDGWIYGTHGFRNHSEVRDRNGKVTVVDSGNTCRFRPDGTAFGIYAHGQTNPFGLAFDPPGNLFSADSHSKPVYMLLRGGYYEGIGKNHDGLGFAPRITDDDHGSSAIAGIAYYADDKWPEEYRGNLFNGNPVTQRINRDRLEWHGSTPKAIRMPDFLTCDDPWFRPVNLKLGPDGALYIADFYNPIIGHYEVPLTHPSRDHTHGRIWRVVYRGKNASASGEGHDESGSTRASRVVSGASPETSPPPGAAALPSVENGAARAGNESSARAPKTARGARALPISIPDLTQLDATGLIEKLADPSLEVRRLATNELVDRVGDAGRQPAFEAFTFPHPVGSEEPDASSLHKAIALMAIIERSMPGQSLVMLTTSDSSPSQIAAQLCRLPEALARSSIRWAGELAMTEGNANSVDWSVPLGSGKPQLQLAAANAISMNAEGSRRKSQEQLDLPIVNLVEMLQPLVKSLASTEREDVELRYGLRSALRDCLNIKGAFLSAAQLSASDRSASEELADVSLAVKTPDSAAFLLAHLERTRLAPPRAGEYLKHALLYLPAEKLDAVVKLVGLVGNAPLPRKLALATSLAEAARQRGSKLPEEITAWSQGVILEALASNDDELTKPAIAALRDVKLEAKLAPLAKIARDEFRDGALRLAALEAAANLPASHDLLTATFADPRHMILRKRAAELLAQNGDTATVLAALPQVPWELALAISSALAKNDAGAGALLDAIEAGKAPARVLVNKAVAGSFFSRPKPLQDRAKALASDLPPEDARLDKLIADRAAAFRAAKTNAYNGSAIFQKHCAVCHRFRNVSQSNVGPNLDGMAARGPQRLIEDILDPNRNVDPAFRQTIIETHDGQRFAGANVREQGDAVLLTDVTGKELSVAKTAIKARILSPLSLMPPAFETQFVPADLYDLLAYLLAPSPAAKP